MKKIFTLIVALFAMTMSANAGTIVGNEDNSSTWWTAFSDYYTMKGNGTYTFKFTNYSSQANNWNNWILVCTTDADRNADGYAEYFALRPDNWAWGPGWNTGGTGTCPGTLESGIDWTNFKSDMDGSTVVMTITREDNNISVRVDMTKGTVADWETWTQDVSDLPTTIRCFLTTELGHLDIESAVWTESASGISSVKAASEEANGPIYNLAGQRVSKDAKGLVIKNGKKVVVK